MNKTLFIALLFFIFSELGCNTKASTSTDNSEQKDSIIYSFAFIGCNRVDGNDLENPEATDASTANLYVLKRIFKELSSKNRKPDGLFLLGDLVYGNKGLDGLQKQLNAWKKIYYDTSASKISTSGIEVVAIPGNHEMLYAADYGVKGHDEWPMKDAENVWVNEMSDFIPEDRTCVSGADSLSNRSTFSFIRENIGFIIMNTDTYNPPTEKNPHGIEGYIPTDWIISKVEEYKKDPNIDHIFVLGHKPYYIFGFPFKGHFGLPDGAKLWSCFRKNKVIAMLSSHFHDYQRMQPHYEGTYQIIAANGGSSGFAAFFGYTQINVMRNGDIQLYSNGFDKGSPYYKAVDENPTIIRDHTILTWEHNKNPYNNFGKKELDYKFLEEKLAEKFKSEIDHIIHKLDKNK